MSTILGSALKNLFAWFRNSEYFPNREGKPTKTNKSSPEQYVPEVNKKQFYNL
jgi:hypothetical protein